MMREPSYKFAVGQSVLAGGSPGTIERRGVCIHKTAVYLVNGRWWHERDLTATTPPCPV